MSAWLAFRFDLLTGQDEVDERGVLLRIKKAAAELARLRQVLQRPRETRLGVLSGPERQGSGAGVDLKVIVEALLATAVDGRTRSQGVIRAGKEALNLLFGAGFGE